LHGKRVYSPGEIQQKRSVADTSLVRDPESVVDTYRRIIYAMWAGVVVVLAILFWQFGGSLPTWILLAVIVVLTPVSIRAQRRSLARLRAKTDR
jgi:uncharacterized membrane protein YccC